MVEKNMGNPWRTGNQFKNGKYFAFRPRDIVVITSWPFPRAYRRTKIKGWTQSRRYGDELLCGFHMLLPEEDPVAYFLRKQFAIPDFEPPDSSMRLKNLSQHSIMQKLLTRLEDIFSPEFPWPEEFSLEQRRCLKGAANAQIVDSLYLSGIPKLIREKLAFVYDRRWQLLNLFARCPGSLELYESNPAMAFALANNLVFHKPAVSQPYRAARSLIGQKQIKLAEWMRFPASKRGVRILSKITPGSLSAKSLYFFREAIHDPAVSKLLSHLERINSFVIILVNFQEIRSSLTFNLLHEVSNISKDNWNSIIPNSSFLHSTTEACGVLTGLIIDIKSMRETLGTHQGNQPYPKFRKLSDIYDYHDQLVIPVNRVESENISFGPPPYLGTANLLPIENSNELEIEGRLMNHCVASYKEMVMAKQYYVFRVVQPIRATMGIRKAPGGRWIVDQIKGRWNTVIDPYIEKQIVDEFTGVSG